MQQLRLKLSDLTVDLALQMRAEASPDTVAEYAAAYKADANKMPPLTVFRDGSLHILADGFQRYDAAKIAGEKTIKCNEFPGKRRDALLFSVGANTTHGARRTNADKRKAVLALLADPEWSKWSNREIAKRCAVVSTLVDNIRKELGANGLHPEKTKSKDNKDLQKSTQGATTVLDKTENSDNPHENDDDFVPDESGAEATDQATASTPAGADSAPAMPGTLPWLQAAHDAHKHTRAIHDRLCELVREWETLGQEAHPQIHEQSITAHLKAAVFEIHQGQPYAVCPCCQGQGTCREQLCHKAGWLNKSKFDNLPGELKIGAVTLK